MRKLRYKIQLVSVSSILILVFLLKFNVEAFCPFGAIETMYTYFAEGRLLCALGTGNFFALMAVVVLTLLMRRVFCGYICPIGAISSFMQNLGRDLGIKQLPIPARYERILSSLKYLMLVGVLILSAMTLTLVLRDISPCYVLASINSDVKLSAYIVAGAVLIASLAVSMPFCRWFCPFAVVQNLFSVFGITRIKRNADACINCNKCTAICPMHIDVANCQQVKSPDCMSCFECIAVCPVKETDKPAALDWTIGGKVKISNPKPVMIAAIIVAVLFTATASTFIDIPTYFYQRELDKPADLITDTLQVRGVSCAGSAKLFVYFLNRTDISELPGYLQLATRPRQGWIAIDITYDPAQTTKEAIIEAVLEPYFDPEENRWRASPFEVKDYSGSL